MDGGAPKSEKMPYVWRAHTSLRGHTYYTWEPLVPRIHDGYLQCVVFLYSAEEDAWHGVHRGASGFLVGVPTEKYGDRALHIYAVTNSHAVRDEREATRFLRLNKTNGESDVIETPFDAWIHHPEGEEIAVLPIGLSEYHEYKVARPEKFVTQEIIERYEIGPGDEVFMVGRFIHHEGRKRNLPSIRFGNISMMPVERITRQGADSAEGFLVEMRSMAGYSGSPVFLLPGTVSYGRKELLSEILLLGVDWGHIKDRAKVLRHERDEWQETGDVVEFNTAMSAVVPAWRLQEMFDLKELKDARREAETDLYLPPIEEPIQNDSANG